MKIKHVRMCICGMEMPDLRLKYLGPQDGGEGYATILFSAHCPRCGRSTDMFHSVSGAITEWNRLQDAFKTWAEATNG